MSNQNLIDSPEFKKILCLDLNITYYDKKYPKGFPRWVAPTHPDDIDPKFEIDFDERIDFWDFTININDFSQNEVSNNYDNIGENYYTYLKEIDRKFVKKILELNKIVDSKNTHLANLRNALDLLSHHTPGYNKITIDQHGDGSETVTFHRHIDIKLVPNDKQKHFSENMLMYSIVSDIVYHQKNFIKKLSNFLENHIKSIETSSSIIYKNSMKDIMESNLHWDAGDTDLLELLVALLETGTITGRNNKHLTRKDAISYFEGIFSMKIKDSESKLTRATERKKDTSPFLSSLKIAFDNYVRRKSEKLKS